VLLRRAGTAPVTLEARVVGPQDAGSRVLTA